MTFYDSIDNVQEYIAMADGYDGRELVAVFRQHLPLGAAVLELGMGPGKDLALLGASYQVTGSDSSAVFVERYRALHPAADVLMLDAVDLQTDRRFDGIYSNKVLHHLKREDLVHSFRRQADVLKANGVVMHSFWYGTHEEELLGMRFVYHDEETLSASFKGCFDLIASARYGEIEEDDSLYVVLRKR